MNAARYMEVSATTFIALVALACFRRHCHPGYHHHVLQSIPLLVIIALICLLLCNRCLFSFFIYFYWNWKFIEENFLIISDYSIAVIQHSSNIIYGDCRSAAVNKRTSTRNAPGCLKVCFFYESSLWPEPLQ